MTKIARWSLGLIGLVPLILLFGIARELMPPSLLRIVIVSLLFAGIFSLGAWIKGKSPTDTKIHNEGKNTLKGYKENYQQPTSKAPYTILSIMLEQIDAIHSILTEIFKGSDLNDQDKHEIIMFSAFLSITTATAGARIANIDENKIQNSITAFLDDYSEDTTDLSQLNERIKEYNPLFKLNSPTPFAALSTSFLEHININDPAFTLKIMSWLTIFTEPAILKASQVLRGHVSNIAKEEAIK